MRSVVIFDLDGTITRPCLDFDAIRREMGLPPGRPILEEMDTLTPTKRAEALAVLDRHEERAARDSTLHDGACETIAELHSHEYRVAILTRNVRRWTRFVLEKHGIQVDAIRCRDDGIVKPSPLPVLELCRELGAGPRQSWMIGDHRFDIESGRQAGTRTILMLSRPESRDYANLADYAVRSLPEIVPIVLSLNT